MKDFFMDMGPNMTNLCLTVFTNNLTSELNSI